MEMKRADGKAKYLRRMVPYSQSKRRNHRVIDERITVLLHSVVAGALLSPACFYAQNTKDGTVPETEALNTVFYLDSAKNALTTLERQTAKTKLGLGFRPFVEIESERSRVRIDGNSSQEFILSLAASVDPGKYKLFRTEVKRANAVSPCRH
jgi:hypothetical protein